MVGAQTKVVFRTADEDAEVLATELFRPEFDLNQVKHFAPATVGYHRERLAARSTSAATATTRVASYTASRSETEAANWQRSRGASDQGSYDDAPIIGSPAPLEWSTDTGSSQGGARASASQWGRAVARGRQNQTSSTPSWHEALAAEIEWLPSRLKGLEEVIHDHIVKLRGLPDRHAVVKTMNRKTTLIRTFDVSPARASERRLGGFIRDVLAASSYASPVSVIEQEIADRRMRMAQLMDEPSPISPPPLKDEGWR